MRLTITKGRCSAAVIIIRLIFMCLRAYRQDVVTQHENMPGVFDSDSDEIDNRDAEVGGSSHSNLDESSADVVSSSDGGDIGQAFNEAVWMHVLLPEEI